MGILKSYLLQVSLIVALFTWMEEDPRTKNIIEGKTSFCLVYMKKFRSE